MTRTVQGSIQINRSPEQVFQYISSFENDPRWRTDVQDMRCLDPGQAHVGQRISEQASIWGQKLETVTKITALEPGRRVELISISGQVPVKVVRTCEPDASGTRFTYILDADIDTVLLFRILQGVLIPYYNKQIAGYLQNLKRILEG